MIIEFTHTEKEIIIMLVAGHDSFTIKEWFGLADKEFRKIKQTIFKKLKISRSTQILSAALKYQIVSIDTFCQNKRLII